MMDIGTIIKNIMQKKSVTNAEQVRRINLIEEVSGSSARTRKQNISNYLNGHYTSINYDLVRKIEIALNLKTRALLNLMPSPKGKYQKERYKKCLIDWKDINDKL